MNEALLNDGWVSMGGSDNASIDPRFRRYSQLPKDGTEEGKWDLCFVAPLANRIDDEIAEQLASGVKRSVSEVSTDEKVGALLRTEPVCPL